jgi:hypothetical protein
MSIFNDPDFLDEVFQTSKEKPSPITYSQTPSYQSTIDLDFSPKGYVGQQTITQFRNDPEVAKRAERFLEGIGRNSENIVEFLRDADYSPSAAMVRSFEAGEWTDEQKDDYEYLRNRFQNTKLNGFNERMEFVKDFGIDVIADPFNLVTLLIGGPAMKGVTSAAMKTGAKIAEVGLNKTSKAKVVGAGLKASGRPALFGAAEGMAWGGGHEYFNQRIDYGLNGDEVDWGEVAAIGGIGGLFGGTIGAGIGTTVFLNKAYKYSNEEKIIEEVANVSRKEFNQSNHLDVDNPKTKPKETDVQRDVSETNVFNFLSHIFSEKSVTRFAKLAFRSDKLKELLGHFRYDWDKMFFGTVEEGRTKFGKAAGRIFEDSYGVALGKTQGYYLTGLKKAFRQLDREGWWGKIAGREQAEIINLLINPKIKKIGNQEISQASRDAAQQIKKLFDESFKEGLDVGLFKSNQKVTNYFPRKYNYSAITENRQAFEDLLINSKHTDPLNKTPPPVKFYNAQGKLVEGVPENAQAIDMEVFGRNFLEEAGGDVQKAKQLKARAIVDGMLENRYTPFELKGKVGNGGGYGFLQHRLFDDIADEDILPFIEKDIQSVLEDYFVNVSQGIERTRFFGRTTTDFSERFLKPIEEELIASGFTRDQAVQIRDRLGDMYTRVTGMNNDSGLLTGKRLGQQYLQSASEWGRLIQQMAHLPLATISSITEPLILLARVGISPDKALPAMGDIFTSLAKETKKTFQKLGRATYRGVTGKKTKGLDDIDDDAWEEIYSTGLALEQAVLERIEGLSGEALQGSARKFSNAFFQANLLTQWTSAVQLASFTTGKRMIRQNAERLYRKSQGENISLFGMNEAATTKYLTRQLNELGIDENKAIKWYENSLENGKFSERLSRTKANTDFYTQQYLGGANRFTKEVILNPSVAEANRPLWFSSPAGQLLVQFAGYPTVFNNTVLKNFVNEIATNGVNGVNLAPKVLATSLLMTAVAGIGNNIRSNGRALDEIGGLKNVTDLKDEDVQKFYLDAFQRWGGLGVGDYYRRARANAEIGGGDLGILLKTPTGPLVQDFVDSLIYRKGYEEALVTNLPFYSAYDFLLGTEEEGESALIKKLKDLELLDEDIELGRTPLKEWAKERKKERKELTDSLFGIERTESSRGRLRTATGGFVQGPTIPNVKEDPADTINKLTGEPYSDKSPAELQMDELFKQ